MRGGVENVSITGNGTVGNLLAAPLNEELKKQADNNGCNIFSIEVDGTAARVELETTENAELVVAVYDDSGTQMAASGSTLVYAGERTAAVDIDISAMPQYFYLRAFLIDPDSLRPLCAAYESPDYTKDMQDFFASTTADYEAGRVLNFDESQQTNFAVYAEDTVLIETENAAANQVTVLDKDAQIYRIDNADDTVKNLAVGDTFSCTLTDGTLLVGKVGAVSIDGESVTITGAADLDISEVFSYVKIEESLGMDSVEVDASTCDEGVIYNGLVDEDAPEPALYGEMMPYASETQTKTIQHTFVDKKLEASDAKVTLNGGINLRFDNTFEYYLTLSNTSISLKMDYSGTLTVDFAANAKGSATLGKLTFTALGVLNLTVTPKFLFEANAKLNITGSLSGTVGFSCSVQEGMKNLTTSPVFRASLDSEVSLYVGLELRPAINIISERLAEVSMTATVGGLVSAKLAMTNAPSGEIKHDCAACVDGDVFGKYSVSFTAKLLNQDWLTYTYKAVDETVKVLDFYNSIGKKESGFTVCPHIAYLVTVTVKDTSGRIVSGASVNSATTNANGQASLYLASGSQTVSVSKNGYGMSKTITVGDSPQSVTVALSGQTGGSGSGGGSSYDKTHAGEIKEISLGGSHSAALMKDGNLYLWGSNNYGQVAMLPQTSVLQPTKFQNEDFGLPEHSVEKVALGSYHSAVITKDGSLYTWGNNEYGQLGDGTKTNRRIPVKVMENVAEAQMVIYGSTNALIKKDGSLYMWGYNSSGQMGNGTTTHQTKPVKIMDNVAEVLMRNDRVAAITKDGSLYLWGNNDYGQVGNGTTVAQTRPVKIMDNVAKAALGYYHSAAVTKDGSLYTWGNNHYGQLGDGASGGGGTETLSRTHDKNTPVKILNNVEDVVLSSDSSMALTKNGSLYTWGINRYGQLGDGITLMGADTSGYRSNWYYYHRDYPLKIAQNIAHIFCYGDIYMALD